MKTSTLNKPLKKPLAVAIAAAITLPVCAEAATFFVTENTDNGTASMANSLSWAILQSNLNPGPDVITLRTDVTLNGVMKRLIDSDIVIQSAGAPHDINGNNTYRPLFIKSGQVTIRNLNIDNGRAVGGSGTYGGSGAGLGGGIFVYDGEVTLSNISIRNSTVSGNQSLNFGGGGMFGSGFWGGGGLFASTGSHSGAYGGYGNYQVNDPVFGKGGDSSFDENAIHGGFGGGGGYGDEGDAGNGGFGGGGGYGYYGTGGQGGFGGGGGSAYNGTPGSAGFGGNAVAGANFGGALFIRSGMVRIENVEFSQNTANSTTIFNSQSEGLGGAIFVLHTTQNSNGNNQGMPTQLALVTGCGVTFMNNQAETDPGTDNNNDNLFDLANLITPDSGNSLTEPCLADLIFTDGFDG